MLILVPTELERDMLFADRPSVAVAVCGFGLAAAGVGAAHAIAGIPAAADGVVLVGAAGTYDDIAYPLGSAMVAGRVTCDGIGAGGHTAAELGFGGRDTLELIPAGGPELVSVAHASGDADAARAVVGRHPAAAAEDMEGYAVALAGTRFGVPVTIIRGISNRAGERDRSQWRMAEGLAAARIALEEALS
ncbi:MAG: hypothetical protein ACTHNU_17050 [Gaiellales bacterium]